MKAFESLGVSKAADLASGETCATCGHYRSAHAAGQGRCNVGTGCPKGCRQFVPVVATETF